MAQLSAQRHKTLPYRCLPGASRCCLSDQCHSWALGNGRKAAGCGGRKARQPVVLIKKAHGHELRGAQRPLGRGQRAQHGGSERQGWKIPVKPGTRLICPEEKCVHWFLSSIGWQWNLGTEQLRGFSCGSEALEELHQLPSQGADFDLWILYAFGACHLRGCFPASLPPAWRGASPVPLLGFQCLGSSAWLFSQKDPLLWNLPPPWSDRAHICYPTGHSIQLIFFLVPFVLKCCQ